MILRLEKKNVLYAMPFNSIYAEWHNQCPSNGNDSLSQTKTTREFESH